MGQNAVMETLRTERLVLRTWHHDDAGAIFDIYSRWDVARYLGAAPTVMHSREEARARAERWSQLDDPLLGVWAVVPAGADVAIGTALLKELPASGGTEPLQPSGDIEIGWHLSPDHWGHGYATEAAARVLQHGFEGGLSEVFAVTYPENRPSQAVCRRLGMEQVGVTDRYYNVSSALFRAPGPPVCREAGSDPG